MPEVKDRSDYQRDYYDKKKKELSKSRKEKYRSDPEARKKAVEASRLYRLKLRAAKDVKRSKGELPAAHEKGPRKAIWLKVNGENVEAYTITTVAKHISRSQETVNNWINCGIIPKTPFRSKRGDRLYTMGMILGIKFAVQGRVGTRDKKVTKAEIVEGWEDLGISI